VTSGTDIGIWVFTTETVGWTDFTGTFGTGGIVVWATVSFIEIEVHVVHAIGTLREIVALIAIGWIVE